MSYFFYLLCQSAEPVARQEISKFIEEGVYFEQAPSYDPGLPGVLGDLSILYDPGRPPVCFSRLQGEEARGALEEAREAVARVRAGDEVKDELRRSLRGAVQVISIEVERQTLSADAWAMLDCLENHIIKTRNAVLYADDDGFYGGGLQLLAGFRKS